MRAQHEAQRVDDPVIARAPDPGPATAPNPIGKAMTLEEARNLLADRDTDAAIAASAREAFGEKLETMSLKDILEEMSKEIEEHIDRSRVRAAEETKLASDRAAALQASLDAANALLVARESDLLAAKATIKEQSAKLAEYEAAKAVIAASAAPLQPVEPVVAEASDKPKRK